MIVDRLVTWIAAFRRRSFMRVIQQTLSVLFPFVLLGSLAQVIAQSCLTRQGFFNYNEDRKIIVGDIPDEPDVPDEGEPGIVTITKRDSRTQQPLAGPTYRIEGIDNGYTNSVTTGRSGVAVVE